MMPSVHDKYAKAYDNQVKNYDCYIAEVLFGLSYEYIKTGDTLLDIGIGTGISSKLFHSAGLQIFGIDGSADMLNFCRSKGIAKELIEQDLLDFPWPYPDAVFDHIISCGVFHFIGDLDKIINEVSRIHKNEGIFAFTIMTGKDDLGSREKYQKRIEDGLDIYSHKSSYIDYLIKANHYRKEKEIVSFVGQTQFRAIVASKGKQ